MPPSCCTTFLLLLAVFAPCARLAKAQFEGFGEPKFCKPYRCSNKDEEPVPKWPLKLSSPGCVNVGGMQVFSAGKDKEDDPTTACCDRRNACLQTCGSVKTFCDEEYTKCSKEACEPFADDEDKKSQCQKTVNINDLMIKMDNNCQKYNQEQYAHCECVKKEDAPKKRERVLRAFYKKYSPEAVDKVPGLAKKADTAGKFVGLLLKLYKKYPAVIQKVKDPQQEYMEKIMREGGGQKIKLDRDGDTVDSDSASDDSDSDTEDLGVDEL